MERAGALADGLTSAYERVLLCFKGAQVEGLSVTTSRRRRCLRKDSGCVASLVPRRQWINQLINVGSFALEQRDFARARAALEEYLAEDSGKPPSGIASAHGSLGLVALYEGDREDAVLHFRQALALAREIGAKRTIAASVYGLAAVAAIDGDVERSARLGGAADAIRQSTGSPASRQEQLIVERYLESASAKVAGDVHRAAHAGGRSMTLDEALAYALEQPNSGPGA